MKTIVHVLTCFHLNKLYFNLFIMYLCKKHTITINLIYDIIQYVIFCDKNMFNKSILKNLLYNYAKMIFNHIL